MDNLLFVYGTLMQKFNGYSPIKLEHYGEYICDGYIHGRLYEIDKYPGLVLSWNPNEKVYGEIFMLKNFETAIDKLDKYEDFFPNSDENSLYLRQVKEIFIERDSIKKAWVYIYNKDVDEEKRIIT